MVMMCMVMMMGGDCGEVEVPPDGEEAIPGDPLCDGEIMKCRVGVPIKM